MPKPEKISKPTYFLLRHKYFRDGQTYPPGSVFLLPAGERPSVTWKECDKDGTLVKPEVGAPSPVYPPKPAHPHSTEGATSPQAAAEAEKHDGKHGKGRPNDKGVL